MAIVPNGVDSEVFRPGPAGERVPGRIVFAGALVPDKGIDVLLHAIPAVRALVPAAELVVCGSAALWERCAWFDPEAVARELGGVRFLGALPQAAVAAELRHAALAVVPTPPGRWRETFGLAAAEAQACGTPVVVVRNGGLVETVRDGETGWVVERAEPELLASAIVAALRDPARLACMGEAAAAWARERFSWARSAEAFERLAAEDLPGVALLTTWQQPCGLARYAEALAAALPPGSLTVLAEETAATVASDAPAVPVARCWRRGEPLDGAVAAAEAAGVGLVHVNHHGALFADRLSPALAALAARGLGTVVTLHAPNQIDPEIAAIGRAADAIVVHGEGVRLEVIANGVAPEKVHVVPHGIRALSTGDPGALRARMGLRPGERLVASVGFLQPHKGVHEAIRALATLRPRLPLQLLVLGGPLPGDPAGPAYREFCRAEAERLGVGDAVTVVDRYLPDAVLAAYLRAADVIVLPYQTSWWEASGAAREAIASGRPVVTSPALAFADLGPAVFRTTGTFHLAAAIEAVLTRPALAAELAAAAARLAERDAWPRVAARHQALWAEVRARSSARAPRAARSGPPRVDLLLRAGAGQIGGGDAVVAGAIAAHVDPARVRVTVREGGCVSPDADLVHLFNFSTYDATHAHARRARELAVPVVVSALYEDWPSFKLAAEMALQRHRLRLGLGPSVDLEAYARMHAGEERDMRARCQEVAARARAVVASGISEAERLARDFPGVLTRVVPTGVGEPGAGDAEEFRARYGTRDFVLSVGRLEPRKNQLLLLEALADDPVDVVLATGGVAYRADYLEACRAFHRRGRTLYLPRLDARMLAAAYRAARLHVLPSWFELPGLATLEALRAGCPVVASDRGTLGDWLGDTVPYAPPDDAAALRRAIEAAAGWDFAAARRRVAELTFARQAAAWLEVYEDALAPLDAGRPGMEVLYALVDDHRARRAARGGGSPAPPAGGPGLAAE
jgi:glycosyltransferase involved in cell wall biosynthesis